MKIDKKYLQTMRPTVNFQNRQLIQLNSNNNNKKQLYQNWVENLNRDFSKEDIQI